MIIENDVKLNFSDVMIKPRISSINSRSEVDLEVTKTRLHDGNILYSGIPIIASNMATGTFEMLNVFSKYQMFVAIAKFLSKDWLKNISINNVRYGFYTLGVSEIELANFDIYYNEVKKYGIDQDSIKICIDVANGYIPQFLSFINKVRDKYKNNFIVAGNIATKEYIIDIRKAGANIVKIGIGQGSHCSTRLKTGVGYPQLSAIIESATMSSIVSDGGIRSAGDIAKAFCAGASFVMAGGIFAGTDESHGELIEENGKKYKLFYGMSSDYAQVNHGELKEYRASEGLVNKVPYVGSVEPIIKDILGGLRSTGTYIDAKKLSDFHHKAIFVKTNSIHDKF